MLACATNPLQMRAGMKRTLRAMFPADVENIEAVLPGRFGQN